MKIVLKLGGELLSDARHDELEAICSDVAKLGAHRVVLVHGGGPQTTELMRTLGREPTIVGGRRVTDDFALDALLMAVRGRLNVRLVSALRRAGVSAVGLDGVSGGLIQCKKRPPVMTTGASEPVDFGWVGDVVSVNVTLLDVLLDAGHVPALACVAGDENGQPFNINADNVANRLAERIGADRLLLLTGIAGVMRDVNDPTSRIPTLTIQEGKQAIADGVVGGGMIPKLEESFLALNNGVGQIHILGDVKPGDVCAAVEQPGATGTALIP